MNERVDDFGGGPFCMGDYGTPTSTVFVRGFSTWARFKGASVFPGVDANI